MLVSPWGRGVMDMTTSSVTLRGETLGVTQVTQGKLRWINVEKPTPVDIDYLREHYPFHPLDLEDCLNRNQRPKIDEYEDYLFIVLHFPVFDKRTRVTMPGEVDIFIGEDYVVTVHAGDLKPLVKMFRDCQTNERIREENMERSSGYLLYRILDRLVDYCFPILNRIIANVEATEDKVFREEIRQAVREISIIRRDIISNRRIIRPQIDIIDSLEQKDYSFLKEDLDVYFGNVADHIDKIWDALEDYKEVVEGLNDTNNSLTSDRINEVMRVLTVIMLPLTVIATITSVFSMNVRIPLQDQPYSLFVIVGFIILVGISLLGFFRFKRWV